MGHFPFFVDLNGAAGLIVGGGTVALRKIEKLLPFGPQLTVVAPDISAEIRAISGLSLIQAPFSPPLLAGKFFVITAAGDRAVNRQVSTLCWKRGIPVNVVDDKVESTFLFPALVNRGELTVGISTGGSSPAAAVYLKERIDALIPQNFDAVLAFLAAQRPAAQAQFDDPARREELMKALFRACLAKGGPLDQEETDAYFQEAEL